jgi:enoyl-CoA hydratase
MSYENILFEQDGPVGVVKINRPESLNALNPDTLHELDACVAAVRRDESTRCVIITGEGDRAFIAGADIAAMVSMTAFDQKRFATFGLRVLRSLEDLPIPVIAAVNGYALGGGTELALACDLIIAADTAKFGQPEINLGIIPGFGGTQRLARRIGLARAREMIYSGDIITAATALSYGLVNRVVAAAHLMDDAVSFAHKLAAKAPFAIQQAKLSINAGIEMDLDNGCRFETEAVCLTFGTEDKKEGMTAFLEKREARFTGA